MDDIEFNLEDGKKLSVDDMCEKYGIDKTNAVFILNGTALPATTAGRTTVGNGDNVEISRAAKGGN